MCKQAVVNTTDDEGLVPLDELGGGFLQRHAP